MLVRGDWLGEKMGRERVEASELFLEREGVVLCEEW